VSSFAQEEAVDESAIKLKNDSEASASISAGNSAAETYLGKQSTKVTRGMDNLTGTFLIQKTQTKDEVTEKFVESANNWTAAIRYEREFTERVSAFLAHTVSHDRFAGYIQRNVWDVGGKYFFFKGDTTWFGEGGYRNTFDYNIDSTGKPYDSLRLHTEATRKFSKSLSGKLWVEYIPTLKDEDPDGTTDQFFDEGHDYLANAEASITSKMSDVFSLKMAYLAKYDNEPNAEGVKRLDTLYTVALLASW